MVNCFSCGVDVGDSKFCPNCGTAIVEVSINKFCSNCGESLDQDAKFCPYCGSAESDYSDSSNLGLLMDVDNNLSSKMSNIFGKSKTFNAVLNTSGSMAYKFNANRGLSSGDRRYYGKIEPVFVEVVDSIEDNFLKSILIYERSMMGSSSSVVGAIAAQKYTPTRGMNHDDAVRFYQNMVNDIIQDINREKQNGTFDEKLFFKKRVKQSSLENMSFVGIPKSVKHWKNNQNK